MHDGCRKFTSVCWYSVVVTGYMGDEPFDSFEALKHSQLETLKVHSGCLLPFAGPHRSQSLNLSFLPLALQALYVVVYLDNTHSQEDIPRTRWHEENMLRRHVTELHNLDLKRLTKITLATITRHAFLESLKRAPSTLFLNEKMECFPGWRSCHIQASTCNSSAC